MSESEIDRHYRLNAEAYAKAEASKQYWSKPSDFPPVCWMKRKGGKGTYTVSEVNNHRFFIGGNRFEFDQLDEEFRWSYRPFDNFEDGQECLVVEAPKLHPLAKQLVNGARALLELEEEEMITGSDDHERLSSELMETLDKMTAAKINELFPS